MQSTKETKIKQECNQAACIELKNNINESAMTPHATKRKKMEKKNIQKSKSTEIQKKRTETQTETETERVRESEGERHSIQYDNVNESASFVLFCDTASLQLHSGNNNTWHRNPATDSRRCSC